MRDCLEGGKAQASVWNRVSSLLLHEVKSSKGTPQAVRGARSLRPKDFVVKHGCCPWHRRTLCKGPSVAVHSRHAGHRELESGPSSHT